MVVQHNLRAMNSNRMLGLTASVQSKSTEKLSSGYKINRAADDAAGLSISEKMRKQIRGLSQASLNAADGISAVQTAEGALNEVQDMLQRMNELAVKAANGTMSTDDRSYIQDEIDQLITEIDRVSETTKFNETYLLRGDKNAVADTDFAYNQTDVIKQDLYYVEDGTVKTLAKGTLLTAVDSKITYYSDNDGATAGVQIAASAISNYVQSARVVDSSKTYYEKIGDKYYKVEAGTKFNSTTAYYTAAGNADAFVDSDMTKVHGSLVESRADFLMKPGVTVYDTKTGNTLKADHSFGTDSKVVSNYYNEKSVVALANSDAVDYTKYTVKSIVQLVDKDGNEVGANGLDRYLDNNGKLKADAELYLQTSEGVNGLVAATQEHVDELVNSSNKHDVGALSLKLHVGADATGNNQITLDIHAMSAKAIGIDGIRVDGADDSNALDAIEVIKEALNKVSDQRSALGAVQNRLEHTIANLDNVVENTTAAESQIRDTDMATEMVKYSNNNILAQAGQAMLAQANQANQGVLSILG